MNYKLPSSGFGLEYQFGMRFHPRLPEPARRISLEDAQRLAITALLEAEERRQTERQREAAFWAALEDEG